MRLIEDCHDKGIEVTYDSKGQENRMCPVFTQTSL